MMLAEAIAIATGGAIAGPSLERSHVRTNVRTNEEGGRRDLNMTLSYAHARNGG